MKTLKSVLTAAALLSALALPLTAQGGTGGDSSSIGSLPRTSFSPTSPRTPPGLIVVRARSEFRRALQDPRADRAKALARYRVALWLGTEWADLPAMYADRDVILATTAWCVPPAWPTGPGCVNPPPTPCGGVIEHNYCEKLKKCREIFDNNTYTNMPIHNLHWEFDQYKKCLKQAEEDTEADMAGCAQCRNWPGEHDTGLGGVLGGPPFK